MQNPHETQAREIKTAKLVVAIDDMLKSGMRELFGDHEPQDLDPHALSIAQVLRRWPESEWAAFAVSCGIRPPSEKTRKAVIACFERRYLDTLNQDVNHSAEMH